MKGVKETMVDPLEGKELYPWQREIVDILNGPVDEKTVYWIVDTEGCSRKSSLCKSICIHRRTIVVNRKGPDIKYGVMQYIEKKSTIDVVMLDLTRSVRNADQVNYASIEEIKNGCFFSPKYESGQCLFNSPHVIVFTNWPPNMEKLTRDRWRLIGVREDKAGPPVNTMWPKWDEGELSPE